MVLQCMVRVAVIGYGELAELSRRAELPSDLRGVAEIQVYDALLEEAVRLARRIEDHDGADVLVSGSANARLLRRHLRLPVVTIAVSAFDLMRAIRQAADLGGRVAVVSFEEPIQGLEEILSLLSVPATQVIYSDPAELSAKLAEARDAGCRAVVGSSLPCEVARKHGLNAILVYSDESIRFALRTAVEVGLSRRRELEKVEELRTILNFAFGGIMATDGHGRITLFNRSAEHILGLPASKVLGRKASEVIENSKIDEVLRTGTPQLNEVQHVGDVTIVTNRVPIVVKGRVAGVVATFQEASTLQRATEELRRVQRGRGFVARSRLEDVIYTSQAMERTVRFARRCAQSDLPVLITGETGTGKELFAQGIHNASRRCGGPFVAINCAALPEHLLESELFGYEEGAFTGALRGGKEGLFELAHRGTIFLDEIGELPAPVQAKLLRILQEREVMRVGGRRLIPVDVRVIACTNRELEVEVEKGRFRQDLFYRLAVLRLRVPPLRERLEDLRPLVAEFVRRNSLANPQLMDEARLEAVVGPLSLYHWPGNVRQLENFIDTLLVVLDGSAPPPQLLRETTRRLMNDMGMKPLPGADAQAALAARESRQAARAGQGTLREEVEQLTLTKIREALLASGGNRQLAATLLGVSRTTLWRKLKGAMRRFDP